jgi:hypothetical protein
MEKTVFVFNKFYTCLIKDIKKNTNDSLKDSIRKNYKAIDKLSNEYAEFFLESFGGKFTGDIDEKLVLKDIKVGSVLEAIKEDGDKGVFWNYYYILGVLALVYNEHKLAGDNEDAKKEADVLTHSVLEVLNKKQKGESVKEDIDTILHDDIQELIGKIKQVKLESSQEAPNPLMDMFKGMENSKICNLAQEISESIDVGDLKIDSGDDIMKLLDFSSSNNIMGDIIKKVSTKMHEKMSNGELKQEDLFGEAIGLMSKMGSGAGGMGGLFNNPMMSEMMKSMGGSGMMNNPMVSELMKMAKKGKAKPRADVIAKESSKERLRRKLDERKKAAGDAV